MSGIYKTAFTARVVIDPSQQEDVRDTKIDL